MSVISIATGKCGISIQEKAWITLLKEQGINEEGFIECQNTHQGINVYFEEVKQDVYKPRSIIADLDDQEINRVQNGFLKRLFQSNTSFSKQESSQNIFPRGYYSHGAELKEEIEYEIQKQVEVCDKVDSIQVQRSLCGGAGSGLGNVISDIIMDNYFSQIIHNTLVQLPDIKDENSWNTLEIYNTILSLHSLVISDIVIPFCNSNISNMNQNSFQLQKQFNFDTINNVVSQIQPNFTCGIRYPGSINASSRKICTNLVPFARVKMMTATFLPFNYFRQNQISQLELTDMIPQTLNEKNFFFGYGNPSIITSRHIFRSSNIFEEELELQLVKLYQKQEIPAWLPNSYSFQYCKVSSALNKNQILTLILNRNIYIQLQIYKKKFDEMLKKRAFIHHYLQEGMDEMEFQEAKYNTADLITEYQILSSFDGGQEE
ncbi:tubulin/FtsZ family, GTPase domain protein (macronuclear) [Tetrahymena thermophila SB210]|uniref:Tubulin/FtsZ family, GTPase domain protein n=1 Tax=Tetrahymena thermophila (strain SB210) TaxID=312017 RepID=Q22UN3_TETTS|nr:tubulin/FtsZ family, GTPase domain protein [Tetrahymena thermophila SB210]EAR88937.1 tubulin/FtsZ family, GTPase domain protein [Tetrahymena thermophila SB210]|eukprot:XP_001009182.1 tubulin/FtsZ family, GTPase domain protein [Tetrahymena thermophila SB210]